MRGYYHASNRRLCLAARSDDPIRQAYSSLVAPSPTRFRWCPVARCRMGCNCCRAGKSAARPRKPASLHSRWGKPWGRSSPVPNYPHRPQLPAWLPSSAARPNRIGEPKTPMACLEPPWRAWHCQGGWDSRSVGKPNRPSRSEAAGTAVETDQNVHIVLNPATDNRKLAPDPAGPRTPPMSAATPRPH